MKRETMFLKLALILMGIPVLLLCIFVVPVAGDFAAETNPDHPYLKYLVYIDLYAAVIPFYMALYQAFKLLGYIDRSQAFSELSVHALRKIKYCAITISVIYLIGLPLLYLLAQGDDAPGIIVIGLVIIFASSVIAVFAAVLQKLLHNAIEIQSENELTV